MRNNPEVRQQMFQIIEQWKQSGLSQNAFCEQQSIRFHKFYYPLVIDSWRRNWDKLTTYFKYPAEIRKLIYTTDTIEGYHRQIRKVTKTKGAFTSDMMPEKNPSTKS
jgi:transposase-like protein